MTQTVGGSQAPGYDQTHNGDGDVFVVKLNPTGTQLLYSTYLGGTTQDQGNSIAIDAAGNAYVTGYTISSDFPMTQTVEGSPAPGYDQTYHRFADTFVVKLDLPKPILEISAQADKSSYSEGNLPILTLDLTNSGDGYASSCDVLVTLPPELAFLEDQLFTTTQGPGNSLIFHAGDLLSSTTTSFPVYLEVIENVPANRDVTVYFAANCLENATGNTSLSIRLLPVATIPLCPDLYVEATPNKNTYYCRDVVSLTITLRNLGGLATGTELDILLPRDLSYVSCEDYHVVSSGQNLSIVIGNMEASSVIKFVILLNVSNDILMKKSAPIVLELTANECDAYANRTISLLLEPQRTGQQNVDLSVKLLNLVFEEETGRYYLPFEQTLEMQLHVAGYQDHYAYTIHWGDGEVTTLDKESSATILLKHKYSAKGSMNIKITVQDINGRQNTSTLYVTVK